ncbi:MAG: hypothetical protein GY870_19535 [archaeon]|nr:hypothetical protein [archaeon]
MPKMKIEKFWPKDIKEIANELANAIDKKDFQKANTRLDDLLDILKNTERDGKARVSVCFIIDQLKMIDPFVDSMVNTLKKVLENETDNHVKEFGIWALGQIIEESRSIDLIRETMPIFIKFCNDASDHVTKFAVDIKNRLNSFLEEKKNLDEKITKLIEKLNFLIQNRIDEMNERAKFLSKEALCLDYRMAFEKRAEMEEKIRKFKDKNAESEDEILAFQQQLISETPAFKGESRSIIREWREIRGEKEALIRRVHCIIRIQGKIYRIITHITNKNDGKIDIRELQEETQYSDQEIIDILKKLVDEEIIPNFMLDQIEDSTEIKKENINDSLIEKEKKIASKE